MLTFKECREEVAHGHGKYDAPMAVYLEGLWLDGNTGDEYAANSDLGESIVRYGKRILWTDPQGFVRIVNHQTELEAVHSFQVWATDLEGPETVGEMEEGDDLR